MGITLALLCMALGCGGETESRAGGSDSGGGNLGGLGLLAGLEPGPARPCALDCLDIDLGCKTCHGRDLQSSGLDLESPGVASRLKDVPATHAGLPSSQRAKDCGTDDKLIDSRDIDASWLLKKIRGEQGTCGATMPPDRVLNEFGKICVLEFAACVAHSRP